MACDPSWMCLMPAWPWPGSRHTNRRIKRFFWRIWVGSGTRCEGQACTSHASH